MIDPTASNKTGAARWHAEQADGKTRVVRWVNIYRLKTAPDQHYMISHKTLKRAEAKRDSIKNDDFEFVACEPVRWFE